MFTALWVIPFDAEPDTCGVIYWAYIFDSAKVIIEIDAGTNRSHE